MGHVVIGDSKNINTEYQALRILHTLEYLKKLKESLLQAISILETFPEHEPLARKLEDDLEPVLTQVGVLTEDLEVWQKAARCKPEKESEIEILRNDVTDTREFTPEELEEHRAEIERREILN